MTDAGAAFETIEPGEAEATQALTELLRGMMARDNREGAMKRDVHIKMHGVLRAEFSVLPDLSPELRVGLFATPRTYPAWVRLSNSANAVKPDGSPDIRGFAIKLMDVPGRKLVPGQESEPTHDFILISAPVFPNRNAAEFYGLAAAVIGNLWHKLVYFASHPRVAWLLVTTFKRHANPLQLRYWSAVPYLFGLTAVKYVLRPRLPAVPDTLPFDPPENQLRMAAVAQLAESDAVFDFFVQFRSDSSMPIEDPTVAWDETRSPPQRVAVLRILQQEFDNDAQNHFGENLSFTPWRCLPEHRPLGSVNRTRKALYEALSAFRHQANNEARREPRGWEI